MKPMRSLLSFFAGVGALCMFTQPLRAENQGFQLNRYEPTSAGEWSFAVSHPWYSSTRYFAAGVTFDYANNPLKVYDVNTGDRQNILEHQLFGHLDLAVSFLDRFTINASAPMLLLERGNTAYGVAPIDGVSAGDPRIGLMIRLAGQPDRSPISLNVGADVWIPLRKFTDALDAQASDQEARVLPKVVLAGWGHRVRWSLMAAYLYRPDAVLGNASIGATAASELQFGALLQYADIHRRFAIGPEVYATTATTGAERFSQYTSSLDILLGIHYNIAKQVQLGVAGGVGLLHATGTPDGRAMLRLAYAPIRETRHEIKLAPDADKDGVIDMQDACPKEPRGATPDPDRPGCPAGDRDQDGVLDPLDQCPDVKAGSKPDPQRPGCPLPDKDGDGVVDVEDKCPDVAMGAVPDPDRLGCPAGDADHDGFLDPVDQCKAVAAGLHPDPQKPGCPSPDRDKDSIPDVVDACPDKAGAPNADPKKNGCPGLVEVRGEQLVILRPVFFATDKDVILAKSFPVLQAVADALKLTASIKKMRVEGHTDSSGKKEHNLDLSDRRAHSVMNWLVEKAKVDASRLEAKGYGSERPVADNRKAAGRAKNRRVEFYIVAVGTEVPAEAPGAAIKSSEPQKSSPADQAAAYEALLQSACGKGDATACEKLTRSQTDK